MTDRPYVDESLAHGQARHLQRELRFDWDRAWAQGLAKHGIERSTHSEVQAAKMLQRIRSHLFAEHAIAVKAFGGLERTAYVEYPGEGDTRIVEWELAFVRLRRHAYELRGGTYTALTLEPHAVARILQRNQALAAETVASELRPAVGALTLIADAAHKLGHRQFAVPTRSGLIAGVVEYDARGAALLRAKTFMTQLSPERVRLRGAMLPHVENVVASASFAMEDFLVRRAALVDCLGGHGWLSEALVPRHDVEKEAWSSAPSRRGA